MDIIKVSDYFGLSALEMSKMLRDCNISPSGLATLIDKVEARKGDILADYFCSNGTEKSVSGMGV